MNLAQSIAMKTAGSKPVSSIASKVQKIRNNTNGTTPGKAAGAASVDKTNAQF